MADNLRWYELDYLLHNHIHIFSRNKKKLRKYEVEYYQLKSCPAMLLFYQWLPYLYPQRLSLSLSNHVSAPEDTYLLNLWFRSQCHIFPLPIFCDPLKVLLSVRLFEVVLIKFLLVMIHSVCFKRECHLELNALTLIFS